MNNKYAMVILEYRYCDNIVTEFIRFIRFIFYRLYCTVSSVKSSRVKRLNIMKRSSEYEIQCRTFSKWSNKWSSYGARNCGSNVAECGCYVAV